MMIINRLRTSCAPAVGRGDFKKLEPRGRSTAYNSGYMVPLRSTQIFASLRSAKTSYSRGTLGVISQK